MWHRAVSEFLSVPVTFPDRQKEARCMFPSDKVGRSHSFYMSRHSGRNITVTKSKFISCLRAWMDVTALSFRDSIGHVFILTETEGLVFSLSVFCVEPCSDRVGANQQHNINFFLFLSFFFKSHHFHFHLKMHYQHKVHMNVSVWFFSLSLFCVCIAVCINWSDLQTSGNELENSRRRSL